jgi:hypothetical protein
MIDPSFVVNGKYRVSVLSFLVHLGDKGNDVYIESCAIQIFDRIRFGGCSDLDALDVSDGPD